MAVLWLLAFGNSVTAEEDLAAGYVVIPGIFYTPETKLGGALGIIYYEPASQTQGKPNVLKAGGVYTQLKQKSVIMEKDRYFAHDVYKLYAVAAYHEFPEKFFDLGQTGGDREIGEDFTPTESILYGSLQRKVAAAIYFGPSYRYSRFTIAKKEADGLLASQSIPGQRGALVSGAGLHLTWDRRDNAFSAQEGFLVDSRGLVYSGFLGSQASFTTWEADLRSYMPLANDHIVD